MKTNKPYFETARLEFCKPLPEHLKVIENWILDPVVMKFQGGIWQGQQKVDFFAFMDWHWQNFNFGHFIAIHKRKHVPVGLFSLKYLNPQADVNTAVPDLGYFLDKSFWGQGLATEGAKGLAAYGFNKLLLNEVGALNYPENSASSHVLKKVGFQPTSEVEVIYHGRNFGTATKWQLLKKDFKPLSFEPTEAFKK